MKEARVVERHSRKTSKYGLLFLDENFFRTFCLQTDLIEMVFELSGKTINTEARMHPDVGRESEHLSVCLCAGSIIIK